MRSRRVLPTVAGLVAVVLVAIGVVAARGGGHDRPSSAAGTPTASADPSAWVPRAEPAAVVVDFLRAVKRGDCAEQEAYVTDALVASSGGCTDGRPSPRMRWSISGTELDAADHLATVTFDVSEPGSQEGRIFALVPAGGSWLISDFHAEVSPKPTAGA